MKKSILYVGILLAFVMATGCQKQTDLPEVPSASDPLTGSDKDTSFATYNVTPYANSERFLNNILSGGVPPDGIPPIDEPEFISMETAASLYEDDIQMFLTELDGQTYLYPQPIMVWHEVVNMDDHDVSVTYCPLTGSCIAYQLPDHLDTTFGTSGSLLNSNLVLYDRNTDTLIPQIDGVGLEKDLEGYVLDTLPAFWIDFGTAKTNFPDALVLSDATGHIRNYNSDPYGSYTTDSNNNYYTSSSIMFPLMNEAPTSTLDNKQVVIGIKHNGHYGALTKSDLPKETIGYFTLGDTAMTAVYDPSLGNTRIYIGTYTLDDDLWLTDITGRQWHMNGNSRTGDAPLERPNHFEVMWFAWYAFYPNTLIVEPAFHTPSETSANYCIPYSPVGQVIYDAQWNGRVPAIEALPERYETATFGMGCFWGPAAKFSAIEGVLRTRVGYAGGDLVTPSYGNLGNHIEVFEVDYDPSIIRYDQLVQTYFETYDASVRPYSRRVHSVIFYRNEDERQQASTIKSAHETTAGQGLFTEIKAFEAFYLGEDRHQLSYLKKESSLFSEIEQMFPDPDQQILSVLSSKLNGFIAGYGTDQQVTQVLQASSLSDASIQRVLDIRANK